MKIFFFSTVFAPSVGGIERMTEVLCREFIALGHEVRLATLTPGDQANSPFEIIRRPTILRFFELLRWCDIHVQANVSLKYAFAHCISPTVYCHHNAYMKDDGSLSIRDRMKRLVSRRTRGIANSSYTKTRVGCRHFVPNAYDDRVFSATASWMQRQKSLVFLGRLVSQKGCDVLLRSLGRLKLRHVTPTLTIIGSGPERIDLEKLCAELEISEMVQFLGPMEGKELADELNRHRFIVVPSSYEEAFGIVALEGLASGCVPIVSERGGLVDAIGDHGFTFPNGDHEALARLLESLLADTDKAQARLQGVGAHLRSCTARAVTERYLAIFEEMLSTPRDAIGNAL